MSDAPRQASEPDAPAMGERRARWGYGYQDKIATSRILNILRDDLRGGEGTFEGVRVADLEAGRVDDFVLVWSTSVEGNSIKWSAQDTPVNWGELVGAYGLIKELAEGYLRLRNRWPDRSVAVRLETNRHPSPETYHGQLIQAFSVADFVATHWSFGPTEHDPPDLSAAWNTIGAHVGLTGTALSDFTSHCRLVFGSPEPPGTHEDSVDWRRYKEQFDRLHKAIATWVTNRPTLDLIDREYLLAAIGYRASGSGLIHRFPESEIPYEQNRSSADRLVRLVEETRGGYVAVVGTAGVGKSTLVQDVLTGSAIPFFIPYYAFLPHADGNRDRGEALTFFQDVIQRLDSFAGDRRSLGIADVSQGRDALRRHMGLAHKRYVLHGQRTILLIDGLDHVAREVGLQSPVLNELPHPDEVPDGFLIILSAQPQALIAGVIPTSIAAAIESGERRVEVSGLSRPEVHAIISRASVPTTGSDRDALDAACHGNPLILTYLLNYLRGQRDATVEDAIGAAGNYAGPIDDYYRERLAVPLHDGATRRLLGLLARAAPTMPVAWLQEWPEARDIEDVYLRVLAPFLKVEGQSVHFIHDSLIAFLKAETRSPLPASDPAREDREFHSTLAERCRNRPCSDPVGRARILHLLRASRPAELLQALTSEWVREAITAFVPYAVVRPILLAGLSAAWRTQQQGEVLRLILLDHELDQRTSRMEAGALASKFLELDDPILALAQVRAMGRLLVDERVALSVAEELWWYAERRGKAGLKDLARSLYVQAKPISQIYHGEPTDVRGYSDSIDLLTSWSDAAPLFDTAETVVGEIDRLTFPKVEGREEMDVADVKAGLLYRAPSTAVDGRIGGSEVYVRGFDNLQRPAWRLAALLRLAQAGEESIDISALHDAHRESPRDQDLDLCFAQVQYRRGHLDDAREAVRGLRHIRFEPYRQTHRWGLSDVTFTVKLRCLQGVLDIEEGELPGIDDARLEANGRVEAAARELGRLLAVATGHGPSVGLDDAFRSLLLFHNHAVRFPTMDPHNRHAVETSRLAVYRQIGRVAEAFGSRGVGILCRVFLDLVGGPAGSQFNSVHRRHFAKLLYRRGSLSREEAVALGLSSTADTTDEDPAAREEGALDIATFLHAVGDDVGARTWVKRAGEVAAGAGSHKDYHMAHVGEWLVRSIQSSDEGGLAIIEKFSRAVEVAGGRGGSDAAGSAVRIVARLEPLRATRLAIEMIDREVLNVADGYEALIVAMAECGASSELLSGLYGESLALIATGDTSAAAVAVLQASAPAERIDLARRIMACVRTNVLPSWRIQIARALQDALRSNGLGDITLTDDLPSGHDDSSLKSSLYQLPSGEALTVRQMAERLSDELHPVCWNQNGAGNPEFDWWEALKDADVKSLAHMNGLLSTFALPEYRQFQLLAWRSERLCDLGDRTSSRQLAEEAIGRAREASWHYWLDGAQKKVAYLALKRTDASQSVARASEEFGRDLEAGRLNTSFLLSDILAIFELLDIAWPSEAVRAAVNDYLDQVLAASRTSPPFGSLTGASVHCTVDEAVCLFAMYLLAFPVIDVGVAARRTLARYVSADGRALLGVMTKGLGCDDVQLEHALAAIHVGTRRRSEAVNASQDWLLGLNGAESIAARSIAKRIADQQGWAWTHVTDRPSVPVIRLAGRYSRDADAQVLLGGDVSVAWGLNRVIARALERRGLDADELRSEFERVYDSVAKNYLWTDDERLSRWMRLVLARSWLHTRAIVGREAAMRVFGGRALSGQVPPGAEDAYDQFYPVYDPWLELLDPAERPAELKALEWRLSGDEGNVWLRGERAGDWNDYPDRLQGFHIIGERTLFVRPEWEWPREERRRGLLIPPLEQSDGPERLQSDHELTYAEYLRGVGQRADQVVVVNSEAQLAASPYRWAAINSSFARRLGWSPSNDTPFEWLDPNGSVAVKSMYWRDGWASLQPPRFESLGEGWLVLATDSALGSIRRSVSAAELHLWVERHSHGDRPYEGRWHLSKSA